MTQIPERAMVNLKRRADEETVRKQFDGLVARPEIKELLDSVPESLMILNQERQIIFANRAVLDLFELDGVDDLLGVRPGEALNCDKAPLTEDGCGTTMYCEFCGALNAILEGQAGAAVVEECRITQAETCTALDLKIKVAPFANDTKLYTILSVEDISGEKRREMLERVFFHDILNTAGGLFSFSELLMEAKPGEENDLKLTINRLSERIIQEIETQRQLVEAENGTLPITPIPVNSDQLIQGVIDLYEMYDIAGLRHLNVTQDSDSVEFISDPVLLIRVLGNLVKNAIEATGENDQVSIGCHRKDDRVEFSVKNDTVMPDPVQKQIFQRSFSTKGAGRGLGTYSIKLITERYLKGSVRFVSSEATGTVFYVDFPINPEF